MRRGRRIVAVAILAVASLPAATPMQVLLQTLPREAESFSRCAVQLYSKETITHMDLSAKGRSRTLKSDYSFVQMRDATGAIREVRQMREVDGKPVKAGSSTLEAVAQAYAEGSDKQKRRQLEQLAKYGIRGAAADLGQMLLMFAAPSLPGYEFRYTGEERAPSGGAAMLAFAFSPIDALDKGLVVFQPGSKGGVQKPRFKGVVWIRKQDSRLARIALDSEAIAGQRQRLIVDYEPSAACSSVMPVAALHRELEANGETLVENKYVYERFRPLAENK